MKSDIVIFFIGSDCDEYIKYEFPDMEFQKLNSWNDRELCLLTLLIFLFAAFAHNKETLLRCMMEIATYYQILDKQKFIDSYSGLSGIQPDAICKAVLVFKDSTQHQEIKEMKAGNRPMLKSLSAALDISFFLLEGENPHFAVEEIKI